MGKCNVVCTSDDIRNPKPSETELERADFFFKYSFDVEKRVIVDKFTDEIDGFKGQLYVSCISFPDIFVNSIGHTTFRNYMTC